MHRQLSKTNGDREKDEDGAYTIYVNVTSIKISSFASGYIEFVVHFQLVVNLHVLFTVLCCLGKTCAI